MKASNAATLGGGEINEKLRTFHTATNDSDEKRASLVDHLDGFQPQICKAHLWHALEGFERYPNYFHRWKSRIDSREQTEDHSLSCYSESDHSEKEMHDLLKLEQALRDTADSVRRERERITQQRTTWMQKIPQFLQEYPQFRKFWDVALYDEDWGKWCHGILHPKLQELVFTTNTTTGATQLKACPEATVAQILSGAVRVEWNISLLTKLLDEECSDVFSIPILSGAFCRELIQLIRSLRQFFAQDTTIEPPRFFSLSHLGITWLDDFLFRVILYPISIHLFDNIHLDWYHSFVAGYAAQPNCVTPRQFLVPHTDDSEVTLNVCLGDEDFEGGLLEFGPMRGQLTKTKIQTDKVQPRIGYGLLHVGRLMHQVTPITAGDRFAYIVWTRSWTDTRAKQCPCCWLNHRKDAGTCICGPQWN
ncbi:hypothetical protein FisN_14Lh356 [Fistulifera solaris]|uniref:Fe2OG dioxygenase domain-containing protein n=1 Tax=Fistulifera solaris TaxID=1519565 RepID=A0A1Z5JHZ3_FISSO|nr:hypothetical protein FisN_14Lh356 [Fistulifera solaris]|eukprot:GAX13633.1 hypothetical protein FisN_14Lh356 [Fistulifera solaris]